MAVEMMLAGDLKQNSPLDTQSSRLVYGYIQPGNKVALVRHILRFLSALLFLSFCSLRSWC